MNKNGKHGKHEKSLSYAKWLHCRARGIGGSDAAAVQQLISGLAWTTIQRKEKEARQFDHG